MSPRSPALTLAKRCPVSSVVQLGAWVSDDSSISGGKWSGNQAQVCGVGGASSPFQDSRNSERPIRFLAAPQSRDRGTGNHAGAAGLAQLWRVQAPDKPQRKREGTHPLDGDRQIEAEVGVGERANRNSWCVQNSPQNKHLGLLLPRKLFLFVE